MASTITVPRAIAFQHFIEASSIKKQIASISLANTVNQTSTLALGNAVNLSTVAFSTLSDLKSITANSVDVQTSGTYQILAQLNIALVPIDVVVSFSILRNGVKIASNSTDVKSIPYTMYCITSVALNAGDVISLSFDGPIGSVFSAATGVRARLTIFKVGL